MPEQTPEHDASRQPDSPEKARKPLPSELAADNAEQELAEAIDNIIPSYAYSSLPVVGLGGSAGSLQALQAFFENTPADTGIAFVVVLHLSPEHESIVAEILQRSTAMRVIQVSGKVNAEPNCVYVIPPAKHLSMADGALQLTKLEQERGKRVAVDLFLRTLADTHGPHAVAIILSGADGDGSIGIKRIKERGGLTIAQEPGEAQQDGMPRSAIATGMVDWVLPVREMPKRIVEYRKQEGRLRLPSEEGPQPAQEPVTSPKAGDPDGENMLREVLAFLRMRTGRDFTYYKRATILRRIGRRMQINGISNLSDYLSFLRTQLGEAGALLQDMLISVTNFFRDREAFQSLQSEIPKLFEGKTAGDQVRVWVAGCATGEEAYSVAMLLSEHADTLDAPPSIQIFATDLDEGAIRIAREGVYPETITADVTEERLRRFFVKEHGRYRVKRELREMVLFALHDLFKDSPFSRLDLITCRNLLIYVNRETQARAFEVFHFALRGEGRLFLGSSESGEEANTLFFALDKKHRLYARRSVYRGGLPVVSGPSSLAIALDPKQPTKPVSVTGSHVVSGAHPPVHPNASLAANPDRPNDRPGVSWAELHFRLLEKVAPPSLIVDGDYNIVHLSQQSGRYLQFIGGEPTMNLVRVVHPMLRIELRTALFRAQQSRMHVEVRDVPIEIEGERSLMQIRVQPALEIAPDFLLVVFDESKAPQPLAVPSRSAHDSQVVGQLEEELDQVRRQLRDTVEQYEASTEEMKASNEELQAMNEELRSASEELETSREELQSINEELTTVNQELKNKVEELSHANSDLQNLMASTNIATIFLDRQLRIKRYTPSAVALFNLIPTDIGRPLSDLTHRLQYESMVQDADRVLDHLAPVEREVSSGKNWFLARLLPYRTLEDRIDGVVLTFVDITQRKLGEESLRDSEERFRQLADAMPQLVWTASPDGLVDYYNKRLEAFAGATHREGIWTWVLVVHPEDLEAATNAWQEAIAKQQNYNHVHRIRMANGSYRWHLSRAVPVRDATGRVIKWFGTATDIDDQKRASELLEEKVLERTNKLQEVVTELEAFSYSVSHDLRSPLRSMQGYAQALLEDCGPQLAPEHRDQLEKIVRGASRLDRLTQDVLTYSRIPRDEIKLGPVDLNRLVSDILEQYPRFQKPDADVTIQSPLLPVVGHESFLTQCISNLLSNAVKFVPQGATPKVKIRTEAHQDKVRIWIEDNGIGIAPEHRARIFQIFGRIHPDRMYEGTGIGLVLVKKAVERMGGQVDFDSQPGKGSRFWIQLPAAASKT